jgi:pimeloyl-ACP methyl ester carboxylesterase
VRSLEIAHVAALPVALLLSMGALTAPAIGQDAPSAPVVVLPAPTGPFAVGRTIYEWTDATRDEMLSDVEGERRSVVAWIWYPAELSAGAVSDYLPGALEAPIKAAIGLSSSQVVVPAHDDAPLIATGGPLPVLLFSHGSGSLLAVYTAMLTELASHGYVVVGIQHPYNAMMTTFADGRAIPTSPAAENDTVQYWSEDTAFVVDQLTGLAAGTGMFAGRLDLSLLGAFGHSFGGAAAAEFCLGDARCVAGLNLDGSLSGEVENLGVTQPFMQVISGTTCEDVAAAGAMTLEACLPLLARYEAGWQTTFDSSDVGYRVRVGGSKHGSFSDLPFLEPLAAMFNDGSEIAPERAWEITTQLTLVFFDRHLNAKETPFPDYSEVVLETVDRR